MKQQTNKEVSAQDAIRALARPDWESVPGDYFIQLHRQAKAEGKRLWEMRDKWGRGCKGFVDYTMRADKFFHGVQGVSHDFAAAAGLADSLASRLSALPSELVAEIRKTARRLACLSQAVMSYNFDVRRALEKQRDRAHRDGTLAR